MSRADLGVHRVLRGCPPWFAEANSLAIGLTLVALVGLSLLAPYSFVDGIFVMNLTGKRGNASAGASCRPLAIPSINRAHSALTVSAEPSWQVYRRIAAA